MTKILKRFARPLSPLLVVALIAVAVLGQVPSKKDIKKAKDLSDRGDKAFNQKNYREAIDDYAQAIVLYPANPKPHFWKGYAHYYLNEYDQSANELTSALDKGYAPADVYKVRWYVNVLRKNYDAAYTDVKEGLKVDPQDVNMLTGLGDIAYSKSLFAESLLAYQGALAKQPNNPELYLGIARNQFRTGNTAGQAAAAEEAVKKNSQNGGEANFLLGDAYSKLRRFPEAAAAYERSINLKPDLYASYVGLAEVYRAQSRFADAINISKKALLVFPNDGNLYSSVSWYYSLAGRNDDAVQAALAAVKLAPDQPGSFTNLCRAYNDTKQYNLAIGACNSALKLTPEDGETLFYLGRSYDFLDRKAEAAKYYERAVVGLESFTKQNPNYSDGFYILGNAYYSDNQVDKAIEAYNRCLQLSPRFPRARYNLGVMYVQKKVKASALEQYEILRPLDAGLAQQLKDLIDSMK